MRQITAEEFNNYKVVSMNKNSLTLKKVTHTKEGNSTEDIVLVTKRVFNTIMKSIATTPIFIIEREYAGHTNRWFATPFSI